MNSGSGPGKKKNKMHVRLAIIRCWWWWQVDMNLIVRLSYIILHSRTEFDGAIVKQLLYHLLYVVFLQNLQLLGAISHLKFGADKRVGLCFLLNTCLCLHSDGACRRDIMTWWRRQGHSWESRSRRLLWRWLVHLQGSHVAPVKLGSQSGWEKLWRWGLCGMGIVREVGSCSRTTH